MFTKEKIQEFQTRIEHIPTELNDCKSFN